MGSLSTSPAVQSLIFGFVAFLLTIGFGKPLQHELGKKDLLFIGAVMASVYIHRRITKVLIDTEGQERVPAPPLVWTDIVYGNQPQLKKGNVTVLIFFATICKASRTALKYLQEPCKLFQSKSVEFIAMTQESKEELDRYHKVGTKASDYVPLHKLGFSICIEDGEMFKSYQLAHSITEIPHCYVIGKDGYISWHGHPIGKLESEIHRALAQPYEDEHVNDQQVSTAESSSSEKDKKE